MAIDGTAYVKYEHHGEEVWVRADLKGKHREHCLCYQCARFYPGSHHNCWMAQELYELDQCADMVTPVWECAEFEFKEG